MYPATITRANANGVAAAGVSAGWRGIPAGMGEVCDIVAQFATLLAAGIASRALSWRTWR
jgi:hypothetical protein